MPRLVPLRSAVVLVFAVLFGVSCRDLLSPLVTLNPRLRAIGFSDLRSSPRPGGVVYVMGWPADTSFRLARGERVPAEVTASSGDEEHVQLYRRRCPARERGTGYTCFEFIVFMEAGRDVMEIADRISAIGGRFNMVSSTGNGSFAGVTLFDPEGVVQHAREARAWPGVRTTAVWGTGGFPDGGGPSRSDLMVPIAIDSGLVVPGDGIIQMRAGDVITARYRQPDGSSIAARIWAP